MLANQIIEVRIRVCGCVSVGTGCACWTVALQVGFAHWTVGGDAVAVVGEEEGREGEVVLGRAMLKDLAAEIGGCLDALQGLTEVEVLVVDNASADATTDEVELRGARLIANSKNAGFAAAVNQGVRATTAPLVLLLNPDAHLVSGLEALAARLETPGTGAVGGMLIGADGNPQRGFMARNLPTP